MIVRIDSICKALYRYSDFNQNICIGDISIYMGGGLSFPDDGIPGGPPGIPG